MREKYMFKSRNCTILIILFVLAAAPIIAQTSGSGRFGVQSKVIMAGTEVNPAEYSVKWKAEGSQATVTLSTYGKTPIVVKGKLVIAEKKYDWSTMSIEKDSSGRDVVKALLFGGKKISIVFE
jgi:hypothetical protein